MSEALTKLSNEATAKHERAMILSGQMEAALQKLQATGWKVTESEVHDAVWQLFGGSFEAFMAK